MLGSCAATAEAARLPWDDVLAGVALIPGPPLLVPELIGSAAVETADLRAAVLAAGSAIAQVDRWVGLGIAGPGESVGEFGPETVGTYRGFGAEVIVRLSPGRLDPADAPGDAPGVAIDPDPSVPLAALTVGWLRERVAPAASARVVVIPPDPREQQAVVATLTDMMSGPAPIGFVVVGDGARTLTERAPGGLHPEAGAVQESLDNLLAAADLTGLEYLDEQLCARVGVASAAAWRMAAAVVRELGYRPVAEELFRGHPFGVGYWAGTWLPAAASDSAAIRTDLV